MDNNQNNMQYDPNNTQDNMQYNANNGQNYQSNPQYDPNNIQYNPNNMQYNPYHSTVTSQMNGAFGEVSSSGNTALGMVGMIVGALLGGVLWVLIGQLGYIVGWVGVFMIFASLKGYELLGKKKADKKIVIIALILGLVVILFADVMTYALKFHNEIGGGLSIWECVEEIIEVIKVSSKAKVYFIRDLAMGYIFTIIASFAFLKNGLKFNK